VTALHDYHHVAVAGSATTPRSLVALQRADRLDAPMDSQDRGSQFHHPNDNKTHIIKPKKIITFGIGLDNAGLTSE
jgi:hypothetical protein